GRTRRRVRDRGDAPGDPHDPDAGYLTIVPPAHWSGMIPDKATDPRFLLVDRRRRQLRFEGIKERERHPGDAGLSCKVEPIRREEGPVNIYLAVLHVRYPATGPRSVSGGHHGDEWEVPLLPRPTRFERYNNDWRKAAAKDLRDQIREVMATANVE